MTDIDFVDTHNYLLTLANLEKSALFPPEARKGEKWLRDLEHEAILDELRRVHE